MSQEGNSEVNDSPFHAALLEQIRQLCLSFPETNEHVSHGSPTFFVRDKKSFVQYHWHHHGDGRIALWCAAAPGIQSMLVESNPEIYFLPPYVAHLGWVGLRLDRNADWEEIASVISDAYLTKAPKSFKVRK
ncbi:MmcQ/YjbR family DNA-binding protein [Cohnella sp.]|uniref:MmcQ/YjbR family DNA-binding protein n=1 Tax=Cohnella sp. TaxID=1883426 RepID=UPI0035652C44